MRITGAYAIVETIAEKKNIDFISALQYIQDNYKSCDKYQRIAYETLIETPIFKIASEIGRFPL